MRLRCGPTWQERYDARKEWHRWFAWRPVRLSSQDCRWLETIERRFVPYGWPAVTYLSVKYGDWEYRA